MSDDFIIYSFHDGFDMIHDSFGCPWVFAVNNQDADNVKSLSSLLTVAEKHMIEHLGPGEFLYIGKHRAGEEEYARVQRSDDSGEPVPVATPDGEVLTIGNEQPDRPWA